tara:strand:- start:3007 stop:3318 length:312 start_codon:yes stop_codon:yes gene_type:complete
MTVKDIFMQIEHIFGRQSEKFLIQLINEGLLDIANRKQHYTVSALTDLEKNKRWYGLPSSVLSIERVEILDSNDRYVMIPKLADPHKILRADSDNTETSDVLK